MNFENNDDDLSISSQSSLLQTKDDTNLRVGQHLNNNFNATEL